MKAIFTTGEAAEICRVSQQTIIRCFDAGRLKGFKVPGSRFRRIPRAALIAFMKEHNIPTDALNSARPKVLVVGSTSAFTEADTDGSYEIRAADNCFEAGVLTHEFMPDVIILGDLDDWQEQLAICRTINNSTDLKHIKVVVSARVKSTQAAELMRVGASMIADGDWSVDEIFRRLQPTRETATV